MNGLAEIVTYLTSVNPALVSAATSLVAYGIFKEQMLLLSRSLMHAAGRWRARPKSSRICRQWAACRSSTTCSTTSMTPYALRALSASLLCGSRAFADSCASMSVYACVCVHACVLALYVHVCACAFSYTFKVLARVCMLADVF